MDITKVLLDAQHPDDGIRAAAEADLKRLQEDDLPGFLLRLSSELSSDDSPPESRRLAGTILKDSLCSSDDRLHPINDPLVERWFCLDPSIRSKIRELSLTTVLESPVADARRASSQVIAKLARIEEWPDLLGRLLGNVAQRQALLPLKQQAALEALEHVFKNKHTYLKQNQVDNVLNALVVEASRVEDDLSHDVRLAAVRALRNVLWYDPWRIFKDHDERTRIMAAVLRSAKSKEAEFRQATFECLAAIASTHHTKLEPYMETILGLTTQALKGGVESAALKSIGFWTTVCEEEVSRQDDLRDDDGDDDDNDDVPAPDCGYLGKPLSSLAPLLLETLLKQDQDDSLKDLSTGAMECLALAAISIGDAIVPPVMRFFEGNIVALDWQSRKAATFALGYILEGPSLEKLGPVIDPFLDMMKDPNMQVRDTTAWTLQRLFELRHSQASRNRIITNANLPRIMAVLIESSKDAPEVSEKVCGAICFLARGYREDTKSKSKSSELSPFVKHVIDALLSASELEKETPFRLPACASAYEALTEIARVADIGEREVSSAIIFLMSIIMRRLNVVLNHDGVAISSGDKMNCGLLEVLLCGLLQVIIKKMSNWHTFYRYALRDSAQCVLLLLCRVITSDSSGARDKAALAIGALAGANGPDFGEHMPMLLQYFNVKRLSSTYLEVMCDICRVLGDKVAVPFCDQIMDVLYKGLSYVALKPSILASFGETALVIGRNFERYLDTVMKKLKEAANGKYHADASEEGKVEYDDQLREGIFKAYSGILRGIKDPKSGLKVAVGLVEFTESVCKERRRDTCVADAAVNALSELSLSVGSWTEEMIKEAHKITRSF